MHSNNKRSRLGEVHVEVIVNRESLVAKINVEDKDDTVNPHCENCAVRIDTSMVDPLYNCDYGTGTVFFQFIEGLGSH